MQDNTINYEALGRYVHLKKQRDTLYLRLQGMQGTVNSLQWALENPRSCKPERLLKATQAVAAVIPDILKNSDDLASIIEEMDGLKTKYNLGGLA